MGPSPPFSHSNLHYYYFSSSDQRLVFFVENLTRFLQVNLQTIPPLYNPLSFKPCFSSFKPLPPLLLANVTIASSVFTTNNMENTDQQKPLINELTQGMELVNQLRFHLSPTSTTTGEFLIEKLLSTFNNALFMLNWNGSDQPAQAEPMMAGMIESPQSGSPRSDDSGIRDVYKKRKMMPRWTEQVRVNSASGLEGPQDDGHSWRKYGQKDILGAKFPRGYYRCTHRHAQGCLATKQVQRSDEDPLTFDITYRGKHTCSRASSSLIQSDQKQNQDHLLEQQKRKQSDDLLQKLREGLTVKTENQEIGETSPSFSFPMTMPIECMKSDNNIFSAATLENAYMDSFSSLISPTTPESNYFSPYHMNNIGGRSDFQTSECDLNEIISATTSGSNSPVIDMDFPLDFDSGFPFGPNFFN